MYTMVSTHVLVPLNHPTNDILLYPIIEVNYFHANICLALLRWENKATTIYITNEILNLEGSFINIFTLFPS